MRLRAFATVAFLLICVSAYGIEVSVPELSAKPGDTVVVEISVDDATGVAGCDITLEYDPAILEITLSEPTELADAIGRSFINDSVPGQIKIAMAGSVGLDAGSGALFKFTFNAKVEGASPLTLSDVAMYDELAEEMEVTVKDGSVTVKKPSGPPVIREHAPGSKMLALQSTYDTANVHGHTYIDIWEGEIPIEAGQFLEFQIAMFSGNPTFKGTVDLHTTDGTTLRDSGAVDQNGLSAHPATDLSQYARDQWYHRKISLDPIAGKTLDGVMFATDSNEHLSGLFRAYADNIQITDGDYILTSIYIDEDTIPITGADISTLTDFAGTQGMSGYSVTIVGATSVAPAGKLATSWGQIKRAQ